MTRKDDVLKWADERDLLKFNNRFRQFSKLQEESNELFIGLLNDSEEEIKDAIGDCVVVLTILADQVNLNIEDCIEHAYQQIKNRKGKTINGNFVKE